MPYNPSYHVPEERRAYTIRSGRVGCLILHGFMGSPTSSRPLAEYLAERGVSAHCPLLPGHGELPEKMKGIPRAAWLSEAEEGLREMRQWCDELFILGHSMGTVLGAHLAMRDPELTGLIMLAPLYKVPSRLIHLLRVLRYLMPWFYPWRVKRLRRLTEERILDLYPDLDLDDPEVQGWLPQATRVPTDAVDEMRKMADLGRQLWPHLTLPAIIFQGEQDIAVRPGSAEAVYKKLGSDDKTIHLFPRAGHELMRPFDPVHKKVWPLVFQFIRERAQTKLVAAKAG